MRSLVRILNDDLKLISCSSWIDLWLILTVSVSTHHGALGELLEDINFSYLLLQGWGGKDEK